MVLVTHVDVERGVEPRFTTFVSEAALSFSIDAICGRCSHLLPTVHYPSSFLVKRSSLEHSKALQSFVQTCPSTVM